MKKYLFLIMLLISIGNVFAQENYELEKESTLSISGTSTVHDWEVIANEFSGNLEFITNNDEIQKGEISKGNFSVEVVKIISTRGETMDGKMHRALKYDEFPKVTFAFEGFVNFSSTQQESPDIIKGRINIAGIENEIEVEIETSLIRKTISIKGSKKISLSDYEIIPPSAMFGQIETGNDVVVFFDLKFSIKD